MIIYFDENMPKHLANGFNVNSISRGFKTGKYIDVKFLPEVFNYGVIDTNWIPKVGKERSCVITQDLNISKRKDELELYQKNGVGIFFLRGPSKKQGLSIWQMVQALSKNWDEISRIALDEKRPFGYVFGLNGKMKKII